MILATNFNYDSIKSRMLFEKFTRRALELFGIRNVISTENSDDELKQQLDRKCGIDAVGEEAGDTIFLASRIIEVKPFGDDYDCFSLRDSRLSGNATEISKLKRKISRNLPRPHYHVQTFVDNAAHLVTVGIVRTRALVNFIATHKAKVKHTADGTEFKLAFWEDLRHAGITVTTFVFGDDAF